MNRNGSPLAALLSILKALPGPKWEPGATDSYYADGLGDLDGSVVAALAKRIGDKEDRRPSRAELLRLAAETSSPTPTAQDALDEVISLVRSRGRNAAPTENPRIFVLGEPQDLSHPLILRVVRDVGGWSTLCEVENMGVFRAQWERTYDKRREQWNEEVGEALRLPAHARPPELFPAYAAPKLGGAFFGLKSKAAPLQIEAVGNRAIPPGVVVFDAPNTGPLSEAQKARVLEAMGELTVRTMFPDAPRSGGRP